MRIWSHDTAVAYARRVCPLRADDVAQDAYLLGVRYVGASEATCVRWAWKRLVRREARRSAVELPEFAIATTVDTDTLELPETLPQELRQVAELLAGGYSQTDIAEVCGVSQPAIYKRIGKLRTILENSGYSL